jgi:flagellar basal-body rod protein FlgC
LNVGHLKAIEISAAAMTAQKARVEAAALNLANLQTSSAPDTEGYRPVKAVIHAVSMPFELALRGGVGRLTVPRAELVAQAGPALRYSYEPGHPHADAKGIVAYPAVDHTQEMITVMTALRAYESNLAVLQTTRTLAAKALEIGAQ